MPPPLDPQDVYAADRPGRSAGRYSLATPSSSADRSSSRPVGVESKQVGVVGRCRNPREGRRGGVDDWGGGSLAGRAAAPDKRKVASLPLGRAAAAGRRDGLPDRGTYRRGAARCDPPV